MQSFSQFSVITDNTLSNINKNQLDNDGLRDSSTDRDAFSRLLEREGTQRKKEENNPSHQPEKPERQNVSSSSTTADTKTEDNVEFKDELDAPENLVHSDEDDIPVQKNASSEIAQKASPSEQEMVDRALVPVQPLQTAAIPAVSPAIETAISVQSKEIDAQFNAIKSGMLPSQAASEKLKGLNQLSAGNVSAQALSTNKIETGMLAGSASLVQTPATQGLAPTTLLQPDLNLLSGKGQALMQNTLVASGVLNTEMAASEALDQFVDENVNNAPKIETTNSLKAMERVQNAQRALDNSTVSQVSRTPAPQAGQDQWVSPMQQKILWFMNKNVQQATLQLDPAEMGHIEVKIQQTSEGLSVHFNASQTQVKEALEAQSMRLREMIEGEIDQEVSLDFKQDQSSSENAETQDESARDDTLASNDDLSDEAVADEDAVESHVENLSLVDVHA